MATSPYGMQAHLDTTAGARRHRPGLLALALLTLLGSWACKPEAKTTEEATQMPEPPRQLTGTVEGNEQGLAGFKVALYASEFNEPIVETTTESDGSYTLNYLATADFDEIYYVKAEKTVNGFTQSLISVFGVEEELPLTAVINELTTVAGAYSMAQFNDGGQFRGTPPGLENATLMVRNFVQPTSGYVSDVLTTEPNLNTLSLATYFSMANMVAACLGDSAACTQLAQSTTPPGGSTPTDLLSALNNVVHDPAGIDVDGLYQVSEMGTAPFQPALTEAPVAWTLTLRFNGNGHSLNGPGNFAIDPQGSLWVANNYAYVANPEQPACASKVVPRFTPDGKNYPDTPYYDENFSGAGYGIDIDPFGTVWVGNFGFAGRGCTEEPTHNSVSTINARTGEIHTYTAGNILWPQGTVSDDQGNIWIANCGNDSVTMYPTGDPAQAMNLPSSSTGLVKPFDIANDSRYAFVTGTQSNNVAILDVNGNPTSDSPISGYGIDHPMGITADSQGNMWVANSRIVNLPCDNSKPDQPSERQGSITLIQNGGKTVVGPFEGGGLTVPWGITVDGNDNVWVANFGQRRLSYFCGVSGKGCPPGRNTPGAAISPAEGYPFDGLTRNTAAAVDTAGNVWLTNNWQEKPHLSNPGGRQIVVYVGLAEPVVRPPYRDRPAS